jgi:predicted TPR repeat methyltransferase
LLDQYYEKMSHPKPQDLSLMLKNALALHQAGQLAQAELLYLDVLQIESEQFDALHLLGVIAKQRGRPQSAIEYFRKAIQVNAKQAIAHCNLGTALQDLGLIQEALESYDRALELKPDYAMVLNNRGNALRALGQIEAALQSYSMALQFSPNYPEAYYNRGIAKQAAGLLIPAIDDFDHALRLKPDYAAAYFASGTSLQSLHRYSDALASYERAIQAKPDYAEAFFNRGIVLQRMHAYEEALRSYDQALQFRSTYANAHQCRGNVLRVLGQASEAIIAYQRALEHGADAVQVNYALAALGVGAVPTTAPSGYVKELFDQYADHFDQHLLGVLGYEVPQLIERAIERHLDVAGIDSLDLGCGTGLCGPFLRPYSLNLVGVDLSQNMLNKAHQRKLYDQLVCGELSAFLATQIETYDLIVAADVFVYIGDLSGVFCGVSRALRSNGLFCFSVETGNTEDFTLRASNRYAHSLSYLQRLADLNELVIQESKEEFARRDNGKVIAICVVLARRK